MENVTEENTSFYKEIEPLTDKPNGPVLVRKTDTREFFVKKCYPLSLKENLFELQMIHHVHLAKVQEVLVEDGQLWLYEEFIHGKTLSELLRLSEKMDTQTILKITLDVLEALIALHSNGLVHRDVKPGNIMMTNDGIVKLIDFDTVRTFDGGKETDTVQLGTIGFASPEQFGFAESDARSDLYSLGVVINTCSIKKYPKEELSADPFLRPLILKATKLDPKDRYQSAGQMKRAVEESLKRLTVNQMYAAQKSRQREGIPAYTANKTSKTSRSHKVNGLGTSFLQKYVPGFRTNYLWKKIIAVVYYLFIGIGFPQDLLKKQGLNNQLIAVVEDLILFILPIFLFTNFMNFHEKLPLLKSKNSIFKGLGYVLLVFFWLVLYTIATSISNSLLKN
ncbi:serine/threonine-protein kinase [Enterococcus termitis]|uniref:non-specific serine/threonine protein kinase n=1 Tax=Enterococcus termitis TaxID=332950 RepID=A0A1E5H6M8_9ENTE|nr:serine/threonine-protein kinase [Enterococcus termitis]OEG20581.1 hypothetical protein BCR25_01825 [Enterococcus termitis]OJG99856.1 hypothetical protein RV18_GL000195 [Enterococcus termitis]